MKKNLTSALFASAFILASGLSLTSCSSNSEESGLTIRILNLEDYIYLNDPDSGYTEKDLTEQFEEYYTETYKKDVRLLIPGHLINRFL